MIVMDFSPVAIAAITAQIGRNGIFASGHDFTEGLVRHVILNSVRANIHKFKRDYGPEVVIAFDSPPYWRKEIFPFYKAHRKVQQEASFIDWKALFEILSKIKDEFANNLPYKIVSVPGAEADDIIATLVKQVWGDKFLILSTDKDFRQLQGEGTGVVQFSPREKQWIKTADPQSFLKEHIIIGDKSDGVPNILTDDDVFVTPGKRSAVMTQGRVSDLIGRDITKYSDKELRGWKRNEQLIDLSKIPDGLQADILKAYADAHAAPKMNLLNYLVAKGMKELAKVADEF